MPHVPKVTRPDVKEQQAIVLRENQQWFALYRRNAFECRKCTLTDEDAWNFDIDRNLSITVTVDERTDTPHCKIVRRKGNKKFVCVTKIN